MEKELSRGGIVRYRGYDALFIPRIFVSFRINSVVEIPGHAQVRRESGLQLTLHTNIDVIRVVLSYHVATTYGGERVRPFQRAPHHEELLQPSLSHHGFVLTHTRLEGEGGVLLGLAQGQAQHPLEIPIGWISV